MLTRFDPFREFDRVFERPWGPARQPTMPLDAYRHGDTYVINIDLPGFDPATIDVTTEKDVLSVKAERSWQPVEGDEVVAAELHDSVVQSGLVPKDCGQDAVVVVGVLVLGDEHRLERVECVNHLREPLGVAARRGTARAKFELLQREQ